MNDEKKNEMPAQPLSDEEIGKTVGGNDPFANLPFVKTEAMDDDTKKKV